ncbi:hypothetical protein L2E82_08332 [Cichorium intybus]|uniref:Uncharacterized protein n=1 Tax=Cichorium intybus TaxID=13427 RepID=A0ACB9G692_CICIN|nr:hypothetical protein L2E82_08332 [Cichorium intybus]
MSFTITAITGVVLPPILSSSSYSKVPTHTVTALLWLVRPIDRCAFPKRLSQQIGNCKSTSPSGHQIANGKEGKLSATWPWVTTMSISVQQPSMVLLLEPHLFVGNLLKGQTVGVIGAGRIGTACHMEAHHPWTRFFKKPTWRIIHKVKIWKAPMFDITKLMEDVPTGELPRNMLLSVDRHLVQTIVPGTRLTIMGIYSVFQAAKSSTNHKGAVAVRQPYLRVVEEFKKFATEGNVYENICSKIAPSIFGHENVKKAVACLLFGGSRKDRSNFSKEKLQLDRKHVVVIDIYPGMVALNIK